MPQLVRLYIRQTVIGFGIAAAFVAMLLYFNVANLWHLVTHAPGGWLAAFLLVMFNGIVFSGVQFGISVMRMAEKDEDGPGGGRFEPARSAAPLAVPVPVPDEPR